MNYLNRCWLFWLVCFCTVSAHASQVPFFKVLPQDRSQDRWNNGYTEARYHSVLDSVYSVLVPLVQARGGELVFWRDWSDGAVNMWAWRQGKRYILEIPGGMARYSLINEPAFLLSVCHEFGHLLGGEPRRGEISYEGQADYYATRACIQRVLANVEEREILLPVTARQKEAETFCGPTSERQCWRTLLGALSLTAYYAEIERAASPRFFTPARNQVDETLRTHPPAQCRLDTFLAGYLQRPRPRCWFKPGGE